MRAHHAAAIAVTLSSALTVPGRAQDDAPAPDAEAPAISAEDVRAAARIVGLEFSDSEIELMLPDLNERLEVFDALRESDLPNGLAPALVFDPFLPGIEPAASQSVPPALRAPVDVPAGDPFFLSIAELSALIRARTISCEDLTRMYLARLKTLDEHLHCVVNFTEERALKQARLLDAEIANGKWRGPLHGIPWGVKDLMAVPETPTTWGAKPFEGQVIDETAEVVRRLDEAGAVLIAKLSVGALAWGDVWYGGRTRSPWDLRRGSSGSSAGSASATAAGGVAFSLGTETLGSIVSPSVACGTSALRPTFGRVPRTGVMALCWSMDKVGPITRSVGDAALVFAAIQGRDPRDAFSRDGSVPVERDAPVDSLEGVRIGVFEGGLAGRGGLGEVAGELEALGAEIVEIDLPEAPLDGLLLTLGAEAACAFDELTRSGDDDELTRQIRNAWPNTFRAARSVPAVEYLRAQRLRTRLMLDMDAALAGVDAVVHAPYAGGILSITNLTGHPCVAATFVGPEGPRQDGCPRVVCFTGHLDRDEALMGIVARWQRVHPEDRPVPPLAFLRED